MSDIKNCLRKNHNVISESTNEYNGSLSNTRASRNEKDTPCPISDIFFTYALIR
jgi:hypothetical protein